MTALARAIEAAGGVTRLAASLEVGQSTVSNWVARGRVPYEYGPGIEQAAGLQVRRWDLWPDDWARVWPELVGAPGAPQVVEQLQNAA